VIGVKPANVIVKISLNPYPAARSFNDSIFFAKENLAEHLGLMRRPGTQGNKNIFTNKSFHRGIIYSKIIKRMKFIEGIE
jgi:hypothetical protein